MKTFSALILFGILSVAAPSATAQTPSASSGLPAVIPIFPLQDATLFPNASYPLHIFEPRYRAMVDDALKGNKIIGMVSLRPGYEADYEGRPPIFPIGTAGLITQHEEFPDGRRFIVLSGLAKFRVLSEDQSKVYRQATVETIREPLDDRTLAALRVQRERISELLPALTARLGIGPFPPGEPDEQLVDELSQFLPIARGQRQRLLEREDPASRAAAVVRLLEAILNPLP